LISHADLDSAVVTDTMEGPLGIGCMLPQQTIPCAFPEAVQCERRETILLVEDEAFVRKVTAEVLESAGYQVSVARNAEEALEAYPGSVPIDLLLADVVMPGMSGRDLATEFESLSPMVRVLLVSGYTEQVAMCESSSYRRYLAKPFSVSILLARVREALDATPPDLGAPA